MHSSEHTLCFIVLIYSYNICLTIVCERRFKKKKKKEWRNFSHVHCSRAYFIPNCSCAIKIRLSFFVFFFLCTSCSFRDIGFLVRSLLEHSFSLLLEKQCVPNVCIHSEPRVGHHFICILSMKYAFPVTRRSNLARGSPVATECVHVHARADTRVTCDCVRNRHRPAYK